METLPQSIYLEYANCAVYFFKDIHCNSDSNLCQTSQSFRLTSSANLVPMCMICFPTLNHFFFIN